MTTLRKAIDSHAGQHRNALLKHLAAAGINEWEDLTRSRLNSLRDSLRQNTAPNTGKTYLAVLRTILKRFGDDISLPCRDYSSILRIRGDTTIKFALTRSELVSFNGVAIGNAKEKYVHDTFVVSCLTGMRHSDMIRIGIENITGGLLTYSSRKTHIVATVPVAASTVKLIEGMRECPVSVSLAEYNRVLKRLAERAEIVETVSVHRAGQDKTVRKCDSISSHCARVTFCTLLAEKGVSVNDICMLAGHTNPMMTSRYIARRQPALTEEQMYFFTIPEG